MSSEGWWVKPSLWMSVVGNTPSFYCYAVSTGMFFRFLQMGWYNSLCGYRSCYILVDLFPADCSLWSCILGTFLVAFVVLYSKSCSRESYLLLGEVRSTSMGELSILCPCRKILCSWKDLCFVVCLDIVCLFIIYFDPMLILRVVGWELGWIPHFFRALTLRFIRSGWSHSPC